jgi:hypothetical protein
MRQDRAVRLVYLLSILTLTLSPLRTPPAVVAAEGAAQARTLAGVTLGSGLASVLSKYPNAKRSVNSERQFAWRRLGGGTVAVTIDDDGAITRVAFVADKGQNDTVDLPCVAEFPVQDSHVNLERALKETPCSAFNGVTYGVPDHSLVDVRFDGPGGQLAEATWYRPSQNNARPVGHFNAVIEYLRPVVAPGGRGARVYYAAICSAERDNFGQPQLLFPAVSLEPAPPGAAGLIAAQQIFMTISTRNPIKGPTLVYRLNISGGKAKVISATKLKAKNNAVSGQTWIDDSSIIGITYAGNSAAFHSGIIQRVVGPLVRFEGSLDAAEAYFGDLPFLPRKSVKATSLHESLHIRFTLDPQPLRRAWLVRRLQRIAAA